MEVSLNEKKEKLKETIELFKHNIKQYKSNKYDEANTRVDFIDKFFELLDWDVRNTQGFSEQYREVVREDKVNIQGKQKAPDYSFRIGGVRKFFVEAKKPSVNIKEEIEPAFQIRRYSYTAKLPLSILTDFEEIAVYDTRIKPNKNDNASSARIFFCIYEDLLKSIDVKKEEKNFDFLYNTFSKTAILKGSFDKYIEENKNKKGTSEVDKEFLKLIEDWRNELAKNIALRNLKLDIYNLNSAIQKIIDKIIFLRIAEDRKMEPYGKLKELTKEKDIYKKLVGIFKKANDKYNSGLFQEEKWLNNLIIDDRVLTLIINDLYYPSPYEFSVMPIEILGHVYEQFLGKTIRFTQSHQAKVEEKPEVRKAGGVYYTPQYIVNYIVENTVGEKIKNKKPEDITQIKILDPACGSGSFLVGAYTYLLKYHLEYYTKEQNIKKALKEGKIYQVDENTYHLSTNEKHKILVNNIYGVDIDNQAVEVTKLSLLLKLLEDENIEAEGELFSHTDIRLLPDLSSNIKCGNSLIGSDFYKDKNMSLFNKDEMRKINVFDWGKEFPEIINNGGFDVVIGNPPYVRQESIGNFKFYFEKVFKNVSSGVADIYVYFFERGLNLLNYKGLFGIIVSNKFIKAGYGVKLRSYLKDKFKILQLIDKFEEKIFSNATVDPCIIIIEKEKSNEKHKIKYNYNSDILQSSLSNKSWFFLKQPLLNLKEKIESKGIKLRNIKNINIYRGIVTGLNEAYIINEEVRKKFIAEDKNCEKYIKPILKGRNIKKWVINFNNEYLLKIIPGTTIEHCEVIYNHLKKYKNKLSQRWEPKHGKIKWYELRPCIYYDEFEKPKIIYPDISDNGGFCWDDYGYFFNNTIYMITGNVNKSWLAVLNSNLISWYYKQIATGLGDKTVRYFTQFMSELPIIINYEIFEKIVDEMIITQKFFQESISDNDKKVYKQKIDMLDNQIDNLVYKLYGLTDEEIKIVEW